MKRIINIKTLAITAAACLCMSAVLFFTSIPVNKIESDIKNNGGIFFNEKYMHSFSKAEQVMDTAQVNTIKLNIDSIPCEIRYSQDDILSVDMNGRYFQCGVYYHQPQLDIQQDGDSVEIRVQGGWGIGILSYSDIQAYIYVPKNFAGNMVIDAGSAAVKTNGKLTLNRLTAEISSGKLEGSFDVKEDANISLYSSSAALPGLHASKTSLYAGSSRYDISGTPGSFSTKLNSAKGTVDLADVNGNFTAEVNSSTLNISMADHAAYALSTQLNSSSFYYNNNGILKKYTSDFIIEKGEKGPSLIVRLNSSRCNLTLR